MPLTRFARALLPRAYRVEVDTQTGGRDAAAGPGDGFLQRRQGEVQWHPGLVRARGLQNALDCVKRPSYPVSRTRGVKSRTVGTDKFRVRS